MITYTHTAKYGNYTMVAKVISGIESTPRLLFPLTMSIKVTDLDGTIVFHDELVTEESTAAAITRVMRVVNGFELGMHDDFLKETTFANAPK